MRASTSSMRAEQLAQFLAVQNTYLSTFQSLGALGLLLGTIGLAVVQLRSVLERRGELALMRATGFRRGRLVRMVMWENCLLAVGWIGCWLRRGGGRAHSAMGAAARRACRGANSHCCWVRSRSSESWPAGWRRGPRCERRFCPHCGATSCAGIYGAKVGAGVTIPTHAIVL